MQAQISGKTLYYGEGLGLSISTSKSSTPLTSDFDGNFSVDLPKENQSSVLIFRISSLSLRIENIKNPGKINIGEINMPTLKNIEVKEYNLLREEEKKYCKPIYHYTDLLGYEILNQLSENFILIKCGDHEYKIEDIKFDSQAQTVSMDWNSIKKC